MQNISPAMLQRTKHKFKQYVTRIISKHKPDLASLVPKSSQAKGAAEYAPLVQEEVNYFFPL
jgi:hypothetical protein